jgi:GT2 family glycosyltransferase
VTRVDIGVVTFNTADLTADALRRALDSSLGCDLRLLVHDNASTDDTVAVIERRVPEADVERCDANLGFAAGMNRLLARSDAPWFLALNSDAWPEAGAIDSLLAAASADPRIAAVAPRLERPDGTLEYSTHPFPSVSTAALTAMGVVHGPVARRRLISPAWSHDEARDVDWAVGAALLMRRSAVEAVGGFDERFFMYAEDLEWCWRARQAGWRIIFEPGAVVRHVGNASGSRNYGSRRTHAYVHNTYRFYRATHGRVSTVLLRVFHAAGAVRLWVDRRRAGDVDGARLWADHVRAHLTPVGGPDGPPA